MIRSLASLPVILAASASAACAAPADFVCNGQDARAVLAAMKRSGADLGQRREANFYFYGEEGRMPALETRLRQLGFATRSTNTDPGRIATIEAVTDEAWLGTIIPKVCAAAQDLGIQYDGWEASLPEAQRKH
ncbi:ribonuclease E inhibitor RraB [Novosphingobium sp. G106]|uniref:ribonuclease E inhibitor RraB n=1 Tax=Novosphingobium sp. G106 TaxID=2849500 RepID=UPI001C2DCA78|nr:ribonuclease E inhibitor RraB [Novosphingobium sp. G106]MBV1687387.1 ribonuclease E inhibitor RraB [Novosphingobium sp. G106]